VALPRFAATLVLGLTVAYGPAARGQERVADPSPQQPANNSTQDVPAAGQQSRGDANQAGAQPAGQAAQNHNAGQDQNAQPLTNGRTHREWESFPIGSWKLVRLNRETYTDGKLTATSTADTKTTLVARDENGFTVEVDMKYEVAGKQFDPPAEMVWYGFHGQAKTESVSSEKLGNELVEVDGTQIHADVYRLIFNEGAARRRDVRTHLSPEFPYLLRKRSVVIETEGEKERELDRVSTEVIAIDLPFKVLDQLEATSHVRTTSHGPSGHSVTIEVHCESVPGSVVAHWSRKTDAQGRLLERSTLELLEFGLVDEHSTSQRLIRRPLLPRTKPRK
jgi:YD repeat-containing protein